MTLADLIDKAKILRPSDWPSVEIRYTDCSSCDRLAYVDDPYTNDKPGFVLLDETDADQHEFYTNRL